MKYVMIALMICLLFVPMVSADKTVVQKTVTAAEIDYYTVRKNPDDLTVLQVHVTYHVLDGTGKVIYGGRGIVINLNANQAQTVSNFTNGVVLPAINSNEGTP